MTTTAVRAHAPAARSGHGTLIPILASIVGVGAFAALIRMVRIRPSYDVFIDEVTYARLARSIADGHGVALGSQPFDLHPPAVLALYGLVDKVFRPGGGLLGLLFDLRFVAASFGALACVGVYLLVRRGAPQLFALAAGLLLAIDPFAVRFDSRALLEAPTQAAAVGAIALLAAAIGASTPAQRHRAMVFAGVLSAVTVCAKETFGLVIVLTLLVLLATGWTHTRKSIGVVLGITAAGYAIEVVAVGLSTGFAPWWSAQTSGLARLVGTRQTTGFNAPSTHVNLLTRAFANADQEASTYLILVLGVLAAARILQLAWRRRASLASAPAAERIAVLVAVWTTAGVAYLAYATLFGTIEEQMYYICLLPCVATLAFFLAPRVGSVRRALRLGLVVALSAVVVFDSVTWITVHTTPDTDYTQLVRWEATNLPKGSVVAATEEVAQFLLTGVIIGQWHTLASFKAHHVDYVIVSTKLTAEGYALATPALLRTLDTQAQLLFSANDATNGRLEIFDVRGLDRART